MAQWRKCKTGVQMDQYVWISPAAAISPDGSTLLYALTDGVTSAIWISSDAGLTWAEKSPVGYDHFSYSGENLFAISDDGQYIIALDATTSKLWVSGDRGESWASKIIGDELTPPTLSQVCISSDGSKIYVLAGGLGVGISYSTDNGATWAQNSTLPGMALSVACNSDGSKVLASSSTGEVYFSTDSGATWSYVLTQETQCIAVNDDGTCFVVCTISGEIYYSSDAGSVWDLVLDGLGAVTPRLFLSADGATIIISSQLTGKTYFSYDSGVTWANDITGAPAFADASSDGTFLIGQGLVYSEPYIISGTLPSTPEPGCCDSYWADRYTPGQPSANQLMLYHVAVSTVDFAAGLPTSHAACVTAPDAETVYSVRLDDAEVGTVTFQASYTWGTYDAPADFQAIPGSLLSIVAPAVPDASQSDVTFTLVGICANAPQPPSTEKVLIGFIGIQTVCVGKLTFTPNLAGSISTGKTQVNGRLSVTHDLAIFNNV